MYVNPKLPKKKSSENPRNDCSIQKAFKLVNVRENTSLV